MKICVVGAGNAGVITALHYAHYTRDLNEYEIELVYDPNIPVVPVGQGTFVDVPNLLFLSLQTDWYTNPIKATPKFGILYENWGKKNNKFFHEFAGHQTAFQYDPETFQEFILNSGLFKVRHENIDDIDKIDADVVFDCRGNKDKDDSNYHSVINPLNACLLATSEEKDHAQLWTRSVCTPDGWTFIIPNSANSTSYGYLFNSDYTTQDDAESNFNDIFGKDFPNGIDSKRLDFKSYIAKEPITQKDDKIIILNGNRLAFIEPLEATSMTLYLTQAKNTFDYLVLKYTDRNIHYMNSKIKETFREQSTFILWHYLKGSTYNTPFWEYAMEIAKFGIDDSDTKFTNVINTCANTSEVDIRDFYKFEQIAYGSWPYWSFKNWYENVIC